MSTKKRSRDDTDKKAPRKSDSAAAAAAAPPAKKHRRFDGDAAPAPAPAAPTASRMDVNEAAFPRGGGTSLTPVELREAGIEGRKMAEDEDKLFKDGTASTKSKKEKKARTSVGAAKAKKATATEGGKETSETLRVEHLNYKRLTPGTKLLCKIALITPLELVLSLPSQLLGHVPITNLSSIFTSRLTAAANAASASSSAESDDEDDEDDDGLPSLNDLFHTGQWVRAAVAEVHSGAGAAGRVTKEGEELVRASRKVELTLDPKAVNEGVVKADLQRGFTVTGAVRSQEDHGYLIDLGLTDVDGFVSNGDLKKAGLVSDDKPLQLGQLLPLTVSTVTENTRTCTLSPDPTLNAQTILTSASTLSSLLPGALVNGLITAVVPMGLNVKFLGFFDGTIDRDHIPFAPGTLEERFPVGKKIKARLMWDSPTSNPKRFALSLLPHLVGLKQITVGEGELEPAEAYPRGMIIDAVKVVRVESERGLVVSIPDSPMSGFVHISQISDDHVPSISGHAGTYRVGSKHRARVVGIALADGVVQLSLRASVLDKAFMRVSDAKVGEVVQGTVKKVSSERIFVAIQGNVDALVWPLHFSDVRLKNPEKKYKVGVSVKCRILTAEPERNRVTVTLKKSLVKSDLPIVADIDDAKVGMVTHAVVAAFKDKGVLVDFFGRRRAFVSLGEISDTYTRDPSEHLYLGQLVKVRITKVERDASRIFASIRQSAEGAEPEEVVDPLASIQIGSAVTGTVSEFREPNIVVLLEPNKTRALCSIANLAHHQGLSVAALRESVRTGETLPDLMVVSKNPDKGIVIVSNNPRAKVQAAGPSKPLDTDSLKDGQVLPGRVVGRSAKGLNVQISSNMRGQLAITDLADDFALVADKTTPKPGDEIKCVVVHVNRSKRTVDLSTRPSRVNPAKKGKVADREIGAVGELKVGETLRGFVTNISDAGLFVALGRGVTARVQIREMFDEFVKEWKPRFNEGQLVQGRVLSANAESRKVELSLRSEKALKKTARLTDFSVGDKVKATVRKVEPYGVFLRIDGSNVSGLCHKSELADDPKADVARALEAFSEGDAVKAIILSIDEEKGKISFGLKPSYFTQDDFEADLARPTEEDDEDEDDEDEDVEMAEAQGAGSDEGEDDDEEGEDDEDDEEGEDADFVEDGSDDEDAAPSRPAPSRPQPAASAPSAKAKAKAPVQALELSGGFSWSAQNEDDDFDARGLESDSDEEGASADEDNGKKKKRRKGTTIERDLTQDLSTKAPESTTDFERLLLGSPNSSFLWIQYMSFQLQLSEVDKAREVGRRALKAIGYREEQEKLNIWIALLNLENTYGTEKTLDTVFKEAAQYNDAETIHLRLASILEQADKHEKTEEIYQRAAKKFGASPRVWVAFAEYYMRQGRVDDARALLPRSLKSLDKRDHVHTISKFAQLEFKLGDAERGKTLFEGIVDSYPKQLDLWFVYADMLNKQGDLSGIRAIFDRVLALKLSSKKAKSVFKKWLAMEKDADDEEGVEEVKRRAVAWTQANIKGDEEDEAEE